MHDQSGGLVVPRIEITPLAFMRTATQTLRVARPLDAPETSWAAASPVPRLGVRVRTCVGNCIRLACRLGSACWISKTWVEFAWTSEVTVSRVQVTEECADRRTLHANYPIGRTTSTEGS